MPKIYRHYGNDHFDPDLIPEVTKTRNMKPDGGFWASPLNSKRSWYDWCVREQFNEEELNTYFDFKLKSSANILYIRSEKDVKSMIERFPGRTMEPSENWIYAPGRTKEENYLRNFPDFVVISKEYDGVELDISSCSELYHWMYGWDVDSIVIWNKDIVVPLHTPCIITSKKHQLN